MGSSSDSDDFNFMEADLHNLYPARDWINQARSNFPFALIPGEQHIEQGCNMEVDKDAKKVEPRPRTRGNIARANFYMHHTYGLPIDAPSGKYKRTMKSLPIRWHWADPPSEHEQRRNDAIERIQRTRNPFIDDPSLVNTALED